MRRDLTAEEQEDAARLRALWNEKKDSLHLSQVKAAHELGFMSQGSVSQYLTGRIPLSLEATAKFAKLLRVAVEDISPRLGSLVTKRGVPLAYITPPGMPLVGEWTNPDAGWVAIHEGSANVLGHGPHLRAAVWAGTSKFLTTGAYLLLDPTPEPIKPGLYVIEMNGVSLPTRISQQPNQEGFWAVEMDSQTMTLPSEALPLLKVQARVVAALVAL